MFVIYICVEINRIKMNINLFSTYKTYSNNKNINFGAKPPMTALKISKTQVEEYLNQGKSIEEAASLLNTSVSYFYKVIRDMNILSPRKKKIQQVQKSINNFNEKLKIMLNSGASLTEMQKETGLSKKAVTKWIKDNTNKSLRQVKREIRTELLENGASDEELSKALGIKPVSAKSLRYVCGYQDVKSKEDKKNLIFEKLQNGLYPKEVARELDMAVCTVYQYIREYNLKDALHNFIKNKILEMSKQQKNITEMAEELKISRNSVKKFMEKYKIKELVDGYKKEYKDLILDKYRSGQKPKSIAEELGIPKYKVFYVVKTHSKAD